MSEQTPTSTAPQRCRAIVEIEVGVEPLTGVLRAGDSDHPFAGWLALATAIDRLRAGELSEPRSKV